MASRFAVVPLIVLLSHALDVMNVVHPSWGPAARAVLAAASPLSVGGRGAVAVCLVYVVARVTLLVDLYYVDGAFALAAAAIAFFLNKKRASNDETNDDDDEFWLNDSSVLTPDTRRKAEVALRHRRGRSPTPVRSSINAAKNRQESALDKARRMAREKTDAAAAQRAKELKK